MGQTPSDRLETVADVAAAIEAAGNEITDLRITVDNDIGRGTAHVSLPIIDERVDASCEFDLVAATLDDGTLQIEVDVATETPETTSDETAPPEAVETETPDEHSASQPVGADQSTPVDENLSAERDTTNPEDTDSSAESAAGETASGERESTDLEATEGSAELTPNEGAADSAAPASDDLPPYRDPDQLAAVYDPEATFPEMTDALGVDVTPQTVRRYMVEHGIHEPRSRASDTLAETDMDAEEVTSAETHPKRDETTEAEADEAGPTASETALPDKKHSQRPGGDVQAGDTGDTTANDAPKTPTPDQADTATEVAESDDSGATASAHASDDETEVTKTQPSGDEPDDTTTNPPDESAADTLATTSTATDGGTQPTLSAVASLELPGEVSVNELIAVLTDSRTVYEVRRGLGVDDGQAREILRQYNLIDLVTGRITQGAEPPDRQEVLSRLIEASDHAA